jgi:hypothetical protein
MKPVHISGGPFAWCATEVSVSSSSDKTLEGTAMMQVRTGAVHLQTYPTRAELFALADMFWQHAETMGGDVAVRRELKLWADDKGTTQ